VRAGAYKREKRRKKKKGSIFYIWGRGGLAGLWGGVIRGRGSTFLFHKANRHSKRGFYKGGKGWVSQKRGKNGKIYTRGLLKGKKGTGKNRRKKQKKLRIIK